MPKTQKELAFLYDLYVQPEWTLRFTELVDKHLGLRDSENLLYINAGTGGHALVIDEKFGDKTAVFASVNNEDMLNIARDKSIAVKSNVDFSQLKFENDAFDAVIADGSFVRPRDIAEFVEDVVRVARSGGDVAIFLPGRGSFGEVFSLIWEVLFNESLGEHGEAAERLVTDLPSVSTLESLAERAGLVNIRVESATEYFEYDNGAAFTASPLVADFLLPAWLEMLDDDETELVSEKLAELIDAEDGTLTFRFSVKMNLVTGEKS